MTALDPWVPDTDCETHEWRSSDGEIIRFVTRTDAQQRMMPPTTIETVRVPQAQGGRFRSGRHSERLVTLPVVLPGPQTARDELRRWARALDATKGEGTLTVVQGPWAGRQLVCAYEAGLDSFAEEWAMLGLTTLAFRAADPYWGDSIESGFSASVGTSLFTWFPFLPLVLGSSDVFATFVIDVRGDVPSWPVFTVTGPGTDLIATNLTTGEMWHLTGSVGDGAQVVANHRPGHKSVRLDGVNVFGRLTDDSVLWPLLPGQNRISVEFASASPTSLVAIAWRNRWLSA